MSWHIRTCSSADELRAAASPIGHYFGRSTPTGDLIERIARVMPPERMLGAWEDGRAVGGAGSFPFELTVPGGRVRAAGVSAVGVLPTHRRRGILRAMMRAQLGACRYTAHGSVVVEVIDEFCPWNTGRWRVSDGGVKRTDDAAELRCDVTALGSVYLSGFTWAQLARALRVEEVQPGAIARADALFRGERAPWCPEIF